MVQCVKVTITFRTKSVDTMSSAGQGGWKKYPPATDRSEWPERGLVSDCSGPTKVQSGAPCF